MKQEGAPTQNLKPAGVEKEVIKTPESVGEFSETVEIDGLPFVFKGQIKESLKQHISLCIFQTGKKR